ncbi:MAG: hypothetical protein KGP14_10085 [Betaproteobacteria bacterium]|nr:hypothetical protein [Betaproteobacteria bacterium]
MKQQFDFTIQRDGEKVTVSYDAGPTFWVALAIVLAGFAFAVVDILPSFWG